VFKYLWVDRGSSEKVRNKNSCSDWRLLVSQVLKILKDSILVPCLLWKPRRVSISKRALELKEKAREGKVSDTGQSSPD
jgi:hypothetical protein